MSENLHFKHTFQDSIWQVAFDGNGSWAVVELRNDLLRQTSFAAINLVTGQLAWQDIRPTETWWIGMSGIFNGHLVLYRYKHERLPEPQGLEVFDLHNQTKVLEHNHLIFYGQDDHGLFAKVAEAENHYAQYQFATCQLTDYHTVPAVKKPHSFVQHPVVYPEGSNHFGTLARFVANKLQQHITRSVHYTETDDLIILRYSTQETEALSVFDLQGHLLHHETLAKHSGETFESFALVGRKLIYLPNTHTIQSINV